MLLPLLLTALRSPAPVMWSGDGGLGSHDIYGFEEFELPSLPSGERLALREVDTTSPPLPSGERRAVGEGNASPAQLSTREDGSSGVSVDDDAVLARIQHYVDACYDDDDDESGVGGEVWPAAEFLCRWMREHADEVEGSRVLELGTGTGACGIYAAALGVSVLLTDGGSSSLLELCSTNVAANAHLFADESAKAEVQQLRWGEALPANVAEAPLDWVIASDVTYGHDSHEALAQTLSALLRRDGSAGRPPRVLLAHEHRSRDHGLPWLKETTLESWDAGDEHLEAFGRAAEAEGLSLSPLTCERPQCTERGSFRSWSADLSIFEVLLGPDNGHAAKEEAR